MDPRHESESNRTESGSQSRPLSGKCAVVTGSGRNIGRSIVLSLARQGANVVINGQSDTEAIEAVAADARALDVGAIAVRANVGDAHEVNRMIERAACEFGGVDIAVSNVSMRMHQSFLDISVDDWNRTITTNLSSAFFLAQACLPYMVSRGWGRIIHISGRDGFAPAPGRAANVTAKGGVHALAKAIAVEFGNSGVTANTIAPGIIDTLRDFQRYPDAAQTFEARRKRTAVGRIGRPDEIAGACAYLCSVAADFVTGQVLHVNGGELIY
ncbi:gluconate 5-dehydrogenase/3-oxoacyl-[acyl-carrier protein] reductase [Paraburkholderia sp. BL6669N2]|uniref:SDR family NAD(P)-dependent oxidoreductase n=1 Tax=Paraburkholderia sp. BL6669N2 TaxID=1938807 RepID=UPI000E226A91|nr:SDR family oxidoreductase [Paraburkholderia sp. BL6669N2]REG50980.1 gluconate 5-dehydrogenase/3-oxoacyl-[acyl-carrier protein] reductase [Paraburkholderia sp. BL6669N2]